MAVNWEELEKRAVLLNPVPKKTVKQQVVKTKTPQNEYLAIVEDGKRKNQTKEEIASRIRALGNANDLKYTKSNAVREAAIKRKQAKEQWRNEHPVLGMLDMYSNPVSVGEDVLLNERIQFGDDAPLATRIRNRGLQGFEGGLTVASNLPMTGLGVKGFQAINATNKATKAAKVGKNLNKARVMKASEKVAEKAMKKSPVLRAGEGALNMGVAFGAPELALGINNTINGNMPADQILPNTFHSAGLGAIVGATSGIASPVTTKVAQGLFNTIGAKAAQPLINNTTKNELIKNFVKKDFINKELANFEKRAMEATPEMMEQLNVAAEKYAEKSIADYYNSIAQATATAVPNTLLDTSVLGGFDYGMQVLQGQKELTAEDAIQQVKDYAPFMTMAGIAPVAQAVKPALNVYGRFHDKTFGKQVGLDNLLSKEHSTSKKLTPEQTNEIETVANYTPDENAKIKDIILGKDIDAEILAKQERYKTRKEERELKLKEKARRKELKKQYLAKQKYEAGRLNDYEYLDGKKVEVQKLPYEEPAKRLVVGKEKTNAENENIYKNVSSDNDNLKINREEIEKATQTTVDDNSYYNNNSDDYEYDKDYQSKYDETDVMSEDRAKYQEDARVIEADDSGTIFTPKLSKYREKGADVESFMHFWNAIKKNKNEKTRRELTKQYLGTFEDYKEHELMRNLILDQENYENRNVGKIIKVGEKPKEAETSVFSEMTNNDIKGPEKNKKIEYGEITQNEKNKIAKSLVGIMHDVKNEKTKGINSLANTAPKNFMHFPSKESFDMALGKAIPENIELLQKNYDYLFDKITSDKNLTAKEKQIVADFINDVVMAGKEETYRKNGHEITFKRKEFFGEKENRERNSKLTISNRENSELIEKMSNAYSKYKQAENNLKKMQKSSETTAEEIEKQKDIVYKAKGRYYETEKSVKKSLSAMGETVKDKKIKYENNEVYREHYKNITDVNLLKIDELIDDLERYKSHINRNKKEIQIRRTLKQLQDVFKNNKEKFKINKFIEENEINGYGGKVKFREANDGDNFTFTGYDGESMTIDQIDTWDNSTSAFRNNWEKAESFVKDLENKISKYEKEFNKETLAKTQKTDFVNAAYTFSGENKSTVKGFIDNILKFNKDAKGNELTAKQKSSLRRARTVFGDDIDVRIGKSTIGSVYDLDGNAIVLRNINKVDVNNLINTLQKAERLYDFEKGVFKKRSDKFKDGNEKTFILNDNQSKTFGEKFEDAMTRGFDENGEAYSYMESGYEFNLSDNIEDIISESIYSNADNIFADNISKTMFNDAFFSILNSNNSTLKRNYKSYDKAGQRDVIIGEKVRLVSEAIHEYCDDYKIITSDKLTNGNNARIVPDKKIIYLNTKIPKEKLYSSLSHEIHHAFMAELSNRHPLNSQLKKIVDKSFAANKAISNIINDEKYKKAITYAEEVYSKDINVASRSEIQKAIKEYSKKEPLFEEAYKTLIDYRNDELEIMARDAQNGLWYSKKGTTNKLEQFESLQRNKDIVDLYKEYENIKKSNPDTKISDVLIEKIEALKLDEKQKTVFLDRFKKYRQLKVDFKNDKIKNEVEYKGFGKYERRRSSPKFERRSGNVNVEQSFISRTTNQEGRRTPEIPRGYGRDRQVDRRNEEKSKEQQYIIDKNGAIVGKKETSYEFKNNEKRDINGNVFVKVNDKYFGENGEVYQEHDFDKNGVLIDKGKTLNQYETDTPISKRQTETLDNFAKEQQSTISKEMLSELSRYAHIVRAVSLQTEKIKIALGLITKKEAKKRRQQVGQNAVYVKYLNSNIKPHEEKIRLGVKYHSDEFGLFKGHSTYKVKEKIESMSAQDLIESIYLDAAKTESIKKTMDYVYDNCAIPIENNRVKANYVGINKHLLNICKALNASPDFYRLLDSSPKNIKKYISHLDEIKYYTDIHNRTRNIDCQIPVEVFNKILTGEGESAQAYWERYKRGDYGDFKTVSSKWIASISDAYLDAFKKNVLTTPSFFINNRLGNFNLIASAAKNPINLVKAYFDGAVIKNKDIPQELLSNSILEAVESSAQLKHYSGNEHFDNFANLLNGHLIDTYDLKNRILNLKKAERKKGYSEKRAERIKELQGNLNYAKKANKIAYPMHLFNKLAPVIQKFNTKFEDYERRVAYSLVTNQARRDLIKKTGQQVLTTKELVKTVSKHPELTDLLVKRVEDILGNYKDFTPTERRVFKRFIPFYSWYRTCARNLKMLAKENPVRLGLIIAQLEKMHDDENKKDLVDYQKLSFKTPFKDSRSDKKLVINKGKQAIPYMTYYSLLKGDASNIVEDGTGSINPLIKTPAEAALGRKVFGRGEIKNSRYVLDKTGKYYDIKKKKHIDKLPASTRMGYLFKELGKHYVPWLSNNTIKGESLLTGLLGTTKRGEFLEPDLIYDSGFGGAWKGDKAGKSRRYSANNTSQKTKTLNRLGLTLQNETKKFSSSSKKRKK